MSGAANTASHIFVVGGARSGTTLTAAILGRHPRVLSLGETHFYEDVWPRLRGAYEQGVPGAGPAAAQRTLSLFGLYNFPEAQRFVDAHLTAADVLARAAAEGPGLHAIYRAFAGLATAAAGKDVLCDDTPKHAFYLEAILDGLPDARVVAVARDPRDYLASYKNYWRRSSESARVKAIYHPIHTTLLWRSTWNQLSGFARTDGEGRVHLIRYEDLVSRPEDTTRRLCGFLGLEYLPDLLAVDSSNSSFDAPAEGIFATSVGRWRSVLTPAEAWWCQRIARGGMVELEYAPVPSAASPWSVAIVLLTAPLAIIQGLWANRAKRGPLVPYLLRRIRGLSRRA
jgi:hypothetical protein